MYPAACIASEFVKIGIDSGDFVTQMKLQKMVFFAHGYHLAKFQLPLVQEAFQAWKFGPVIPEIYQAFKIYGSSPIYTNNTSFSGWWISGYKLTPEAREAIDYTWSVTKRMTASALSNWTHQQNSPWWKTYKPDEANKVISNEDIQEYFQALLTKGSPASA